MLDPQSGKYHLLVTEIAGSCGMATWARMSQTTHAVGDLAAGPFTKVDVGIPTQSHNAFYSFSPPDKKHLVYHIGYGADPHDVQSEADLPRWLHARWPWHPPASGNALAGRHLSPLPRGIRSLR